jgi:glycosyltransferase involved in cell wall biosynthesis
MNNPVFLTVIICTRNRANDLKECLSALVLQLRRFDDVEIVIVDNASTDNTKSIVDSFAKEQNAPIRYCYESKVGLCSARNRGRLEARGEVLSFIDDDAIPQGGWIEAIVDNFRDPSASAVGGRVFVTPKGGTPPWFPTELLWAAGLADHGDKVQPMNMPKEMPPGGNFAVRTSVFDDLNGFDERLAIYGDDDDFFWRAHAKGYKATYDPKMAINHCPTLDRKILIRKAYAWGKGRAMLDIIHRGRGLSIYLQALHSLIFATYIGMRWALSPSFFRAYGFWIYWGRFVQIVFGGERVSTKNN